MKKTILLFVIVLCSITLHAQVSNPTDITQLKEKVSKAYNELGALSTLNDYQTFLKSAETLYPSMEDKKTLSLWLSKTYYDMARKFKSAEKKTMMDKQVNNASLTPTERKIYLNKSKKYLEVYLGYNEDSSPKRFEHINNQLISVEKEIQ